MGGERGRGGGALIMTNLYLEQFEKEAFTHTGPSSLQKLRREGMERFVALGFPTTDWEEWRFTNVRPVAESAFQLADPARSNGLSPETLERLKHLPLNPMEGCDLVFVNGHYSKDLTCLTGLPPGVIVKSLAEILREEPERILPFLGRLAKFEDHPFTALNTAFLRDGAFIFIPKGTVLKRPLHLLFISHPDGQATVSHSRNLIVAEAGSEASVIESYIGLGSASSFTNAVTEIAAAEGATLDHYKLQGESESAFHFSTIAARQGKDSRFTSHSVSIGGGLVRNDIGTVLDGEGAHCMLNGLYLASGRQLVDHHTVIDHARPHGTSNELYKGILGGKSHGIFNGKILVRPGAEKTEARQTNKNLLLSDDAVIDTKPLLEIFNNDVKCNHGATIGRLDPQQIFYLRSRGIGEERARQILTYAFAGDLIALMKIKSLRVRLEEMISLHLMRGRKISEAS
jgi:Fe-S cluster assembly protein SufD